MFRNARILLSNSAQRHLTTVARIEIPKSVSEEFAHEIQKIYPSSNPALRVKPFSKKESEVWNAGLVKIIESNEPSFFEELKESQLTKPSATILSGITIPDFPKEQIPTALKDEDEESLKRMARASEISILAYSSLLGFVPNDYVQGYLTSLIYTIAECSKDPSSYRSSSADLKWHNDGWKGGEPFPIVSLMGIIGNKSAKTKIISSEDIIEYFLNNNQKELLETLNQFCYTDPDDYEYKQTKILDPKTRRIAYAQYGNFTPVHGSISKLEEAISFLNQALHEITPQTIEISTGVLALIDNLHSSHSREGDAQGRLLIRSLGYQKDNQLVK